MAVLLPGRRVMLGWGECQTQHRHVQTIATKERSRHEQRNRADQERVTTSSRFPEACEGIKHQGPVFPARANRRPDPLMTPKDAPISMTAQSPMH
jgi:hypothetical protein